MSTKLNYKRIVHILRNQQGRGSLQMIALHVILTINITTVKLIAEGFEIGQKCIT